MKIRIEKVNESKKEVISSVLCLYNSDKCVVLYVDLSKKYQQPTAYQGSSVWFGTERLVVDDLPFKPNIYAHTSRYTCYVTLFDENLNRDLTEEHILWQVEDGYSIWPPKNNNSKNNRDI